MSFWSDLKNGANALIEQAKNEVAKFNNNDFAEASMAMCAMIAYADGNCDSDERSKTARFIQSNEALSVFEPSSLKEKFDKYCGILDNDFDFGKLDCLAAIGKLKGKDDQARTVLRVGIIIGGADGDFDDDEKAAVKESCHSLGINPSEFEL